MKPQKNPQIFINKCELVKTTCDAVVKQSKYVTINVPPISKIIEGFQYTQFNDFEHHQISSQNQQKQLMYLFILDSLNFCFWPLQGFQYQHLAQYVKKAVETNALTIEALKNMNVQGIRKIFNQQVPLENERARILRQLGGIMQKKFKNSFKNIIGLAQNSAVKLLQILTQSFLNFQDHSIYKGHQTHFYKRSQILIGDIYAKFKNKGCGYFYDIQQLTMFPDYRVPQILNEYKIMQYNQQLQKIIDNKQQIPSGSEMQIQIRAATVVAVQIIKSELLKIGKKVTSIEVDWYLWELGEKNLKQICNHHRTLTIYY